jgi:hypothetical protein
MAAPVISPNNCASTAAPKRHAGYAIRPSAICVRGSAPAISVLAVSAEHPIWARTNSTGVTEGRAEARLWDEGKSPNDIRSLRAFMEATRKIPLDSTPASGKKVGEQNALRTW